MKHMSRRPLTRLLSSVAAPFLRPASSSRLTLCLDLDECLVHCTVADSVEATFMEQNGAEAVRSAAALYDHAGQHRQRRRRSRAPPDHELELPYLEDPVQLHKRPQLDDFLTEATKMCDVVLFTSAAATYASACAALLDPEQRTFSALLTREHCALSDGLYLKDLSQLGRPLERVVCVDDHVGSCMLQPDNCVPVSPYLGEPEDHELGHVLSVLHRLRDVDDVRPQLRGMYGLQASMLARVREARRRTEG
jgi:RNA polymerase II subunit A small phosphatase-like protein